MVVGLMGRDGEDVSGTISAEPFEVGQESLVAGNFRQEALQQDPWTRLRLQFEDRVRQPVRVHYQDPWQRVWRVTKNVAPFLACDLLIIVAALSIAALLTALVTHSSVVNLSSGAWLAVGGLVTLLATGNYRLIGTSPVVELRRLALGATAFVVIALVIFRALQLPVASSSLFAGVACLLLLSGLLVGRTLLRALVRKWRWWGEPLLIFGERNACERVYDRVCKEADRGLRPIVVLSGDTRPDQRRRYVRIRSERHVSPVVRRLGVAWAIIAEPTRGEDVALWQYVTRNIPHVLIERTCGLPSLWTQAKELGSHTALHVRNELAMPIPRAVKRAFDVFIAGSLLLLLLPVFVAIGTAIMLVSRGAMLYGHRRYGRNQLPFKAWKFRTMVHNADEALRQYLVDNPQAQDEWARDQKLRNDPRVIPVIGKVLRQWSLDELPQLWNVITGQMSLVGPRPIVTEEIERYGDDYYAYQLVRPGITGLWQVSGRNQTSYEERVEFDKYYVQNWSPWLDLYILIRTIPTVLFREGAY